MNFKKSFHEMKKIFFLTLFLFTVAFFSQSAKAQTEAQRVELCTKLAGGATFQSDYPVQLAAAKDGERAPVFRQALALRAGHRYRFTICTDEESPGEAVLQLYDEAKLMGSSYNPETGKEYQNFDFDCHKTAIYIIFISVKDGKEGSAIALLSHVKTL
jgi:hypothetical protein